MNIDIEHKKEIKEIIKKAEFYTDYTNALDVKEAIEKLQLLDYRTVYECKKELEQEGYKKI